ncbi:hypothetical protein AZH53_07525 [Methanomicrobiaceae archaeon CYW5]|nr:hypothetical protein [Methanovulcanius yangii]
MHLAGTVKRASLSTAATGAAVGAATLAATGTTGTAVGTPLSAAFAAVIIAGSSPTTTVPTATATVIVSVVHEINSERYMLYEIIELRITPKSTGSGSTHLKPNFRGNIALKLISNADYPIFIRRRTTPP